MFPFEISSSYFNPEISSSRCSDSSISTISSSPSDSLSSPKQVPCFFDPSTCKYQSFSVPEKIVYYMAKNVTNAETFKKLVETCKYFFTVHPVIVVPRIICCDHEWSPCNAGECHVGYNYDQPLNFKIWVTESFIGFSGDVSQLIPLIYKNDATSVDLLCEPLKFDQFFVLAGNAKELLMWGQMVKYENGKTVQLEDIVRNLPKLKILDFNSYSEGSNVNSDTARKLMEIEHFKNISQMKLYNVSEALDVEEMFNLILENKHIQIDLRYRQEISDSYKELVLKYAHLLRKENGNSSRIEFTGMDYANVHEISYSEDESVDSDNLISFFYENEDLLFPWNNEDEEEWELPWDKTE